MAKKRIGYRMYGFREDNRLISRMTQMEEYFNEKFANIVVDDSNVDNVVKEAVEESLSGVNCQFERVHRHIDCAENNIIGSIEENSNKICTCHLATKEDICQAVCNVNRHVDEKFDEIDFMKQFSDLNEQIESLKK